MMRLFVIAAALALSSPVFGQQQSADPVALQKAIMAIQQQRNTALDQAAGFQVQAATLAEENAKLKAELEAMKKSNAPVEAPIGQGK